MRLNKKSAILFELHETTTFKFYNQIQRLVYLKTIFDYFAYFCFQHIHHGFCNSVFVLLYKKN